MDPTTTTGESGPPPSLGGEQLQTDPDPFAEMDPDIFTAGFSGQKVKEQATGDSHSQSGNEKEISSGESDVDMRETETTYGTHAEATINSDPNKVTAEPLRISELSAAEIKKKYLEIMAKGKSAPGQNVKQSVVTTKAIPAEADAVPSDSYKKIHASKLLKGKPAASGGTGSDQVLNSECGSFFNPGDNRILRTVYQEDPMSLSVTSLSFNPVTWECSQCPKKHKILDQGGRGNCSVPTIVLTDQNFPGVLPTISGKCLSIVRLEQGKIDELGDLLIKILPKGGLPRGTIVVVGSLSQLQKENVSGYATACVKIVKRFDSFFKKRNQDSPVCSASHGRV
jgi:hypothetical protein